MLINELAPTDLPHFQVGSHTLSSSRLAVALLSEAFDPQSMAENLWQRFTDARKASLENGDAWLVQKMLTVRLESPDGYPLRVSIGSSGWSSLVDLCKASILIKRIISDWAKEFFFALLLPG